MYIDGYLIPVLKGGREAYIKMAREAGKIFIEHGAIRVVEAIDEDVAHGKTTDFWMAVKAEEGENIIFSWVEWKDKAARDEGNKKIMADERMNNFGEMPFCMKRIMMGGFEVVSESKE